MRLAKMIGVAALLLCTNSVWAVGGAVGFGKGLSNLNAYRMAVLWDLGPWFSEQERYHYHGFWEASAARWTAGHGNFHGSRENTSIFTTGPQIRWQRSEADRFGNWPYIEAGVGLSWMSKKEIGGRRMSMHFQFEDRIGFGLRWGENARWDINLRGIHYSNASLGHNNSGMNVVLVSIGEWF